MTGPSYFSTTSRKTKILYPTPGIYTSFPNDNPIHTHIHHIHTNTHTNTIHHTNVLFPIIRPNFGQVMDSQMNSELHDKILDELMVSLSGDQPDYSLLGFEVEEILENNDPPTKLYSIIEELMDS